jgi:hypothetical protein
MLDDGRWPTPPRWLSISRWIGLSAGSWISRSISTSRQRTVGPRGETSRVDRITQSWNRCRATRSMPATGFGKNMPTARSSVPARTISTTCARSPSCRRIDSDGVSCVKRAMARGSR